MTDKGADLRDDTHHTEMKRTMSPDSFGDSCPVCGEEFDSGSSGVVWSDRENSTDVRAWVRECTGPIPDHASSEIEGLADGEPVSFSYVHKDEHIDLNAATPEEDDGDIECPSCGRSRETYVSDMGSPHAHLGRTAPAAAASIGTVEVYVCAECHELLPEEPPYDSPPYLRPAYRCGRATQHGDPCLAYVGGPWEACRYHRENGFPDGEFEL